MSSAGDKSDMRQEFTRLMPHLRAFANSLTRNRDLSDDLVQETLIKAWQHRDQFAEGSNLKAWLFTILRNSYLSHLRKRKFETEDPEGALASRLSVSGSQSSHMDLMDFSAAFDKLSAEQREALVLIGAEGFSYEEAALVCGCAVGTMKSRVNRARLKLADLLGLAEVSTV